MRKSNYYGVSEETGIIRDEFGNTVSISEFKAMLAFADPQPDMTGVLKHYVMFSYDLNKLQEFYRN